MRGRDWLQIGAGVASHVPGLLRALRGEQATRGSDSARYCYAVWLRHLVRAGNSGLPTHFATVGELGPGDSLGSGIAALLCGSDRYLALDVVRYAPQLRNVEILHELVELFRARAAIPGDEEFPQVRPRLDDYAFPTALLPEALLEKALAPERIDAIEAALLGEPNDCGIEIEYRVPWDQAIEPGVADLVFSQACLEHVSELPETYATMARWLRPGGATSHQIDLKSHKLTPEWDGHRRFSAPLWRVLCGARPNLINRAPCSVHRKLAGMHFEITGCEVIELEPATPERELAAAFRGLSSEDRRASGLFFQGRRAEQA